MKTEKGRQSDERRTFHQTATAQKQWGAATVFHRLRIRLRQNDEADELPHREGRHSHPRRLRPEGAGGPLGNGWARHDRHRGRPADAQPRRPRRRIRRLGSHGQVRRRALHEEGKAQRGNHGGVSAYPLGSHLARRPRVQRRGEVGPPPPPLRKLLQGHSPPVEDPAAS